MGELGPLGRKSCGDFWGVRRKPAAMAVPWHFFSFQSQGIRLM